MSQDGDMASVIVAGLCHEIAHHEREARVAETMRHLFVGAYTRGHCRAEQIKKFDIASMSDPATEAPNTEQREVRLCYGHPQALQLLLEDCREVAEWVHP